MKNNILFLTISLLFITYNQNIFSMDKTDSTIQTEQLHRTYRQINQKNKSKFDDYFRTHATGQEDLNEQIPMIKKKLNDYEDKLTNHKSNLLEQFLKRHEIKQDLWFGMTVWAAHNHREREKDLSNPLSKNVCDEKFPADFKLLIQSELVANDMHPEAFDFLCTDIPTCILGHHDATPKACGKITVNPDIFARFSLEIKKTWSIIVIEIIKDRMDITLDCFTEFNKMIEDIHYPQSLKTLMNRQVPIAVLKASLRNKENASRLKKYAFNHCPITDSFTPDDYNFLSKIERHWTILEFLTKHAALYEKIKSLSFVQSDEEKKEQTEGTSSYCSSLSTLRR